MLFYNELSGFRFLSMYYTIFIFTFWHYTIYYTIFLKDYTILQHLTILFLHCRITLNPYKSRISGCLCTLFFITHLEDVEFQIIRLICRPQNRMISGLRPELHLSQPHMCSCRRLAYGFCKKFKIHKMRTGTSCQISSVFDKFHSPDIDLSISLNCIFYGIS